MRMDKALSGCPEPRIAPMGVNTSISKRMPVTFPRTVQADRLQFGKSNYERYAPAEKPLDWPVYDKKNKKWQTLHLKRWWPNGEAESPVVQGKPVILYVHGLFSSSKAMAPLARDMMKLKPMAGFTHYALDLKEFWPYTREKGRIENFNEVADKVRLAIQELGKMYNSPVYAVGASMGGLLLAYVAAGEEKRPACLQKLGLISPAFAVFKKWENRDFDLDKLDPLQAEIRRQLTNPPSKRLDNGSLRRMFWFQWKFRHMLAKHLTLPVTIIAPKHDPTVKTAVTAEVFEEIPVRQKEFIQTDEGEHNQVLDPQCGKVAQAFCHAFTGEGEMPTFPAPQPRPPESFKDALKRKIMDWL